jgi:hypothetical protein
VQYGIIRLYRQGGNLTFRSKEMLKNPIASVGNAKWVRGGYKSSPLGGFIRL